MLYGKDSLNNEYMRKAAEISKNYPLYWQDFVEKAGNRYSGLDLPLYGQHRHFFEIPFEE